MKVLVADKFEEIGLEGLKNLGLEVIYEPNLKDDSLRDRLAETAAHILVVRSTKVTAEMIEAAHLGVIIRAGAGYNTIDVGAASNRGVYVTNCPGKNSSAVAELALGLMIACDRHIPDNVIDLRNGKWNKKKYSQARGLAGRTLGLVGLGMISQKLIPVAKALGMTVIAYSRWMTSDVAAALGIGRANSIEEVAVQSDFISVHVSLTPATKGLLSTDFFDKMREGAVFVNTSRAEVVDQAALVKAVKEGRIKAGLDVFDGEPTEGVADYSGELKDLDGVYCTHHIGASTDEAQNAVALEVVHIVKDYRSHGVPPNVVNLPSGDKSSHVLVIRHADRVGVLASVLGVLKDDGVNVQEMENVILGPSHAAIAQIAVAKEPSPSALHTLRSNSLVFDVTLMSISH